MRPARFARTLLAAGAAVALGAMGTAPAHASAQPTVDVFFSDVTIPATGPGVVERVTLLASEPVVLDQIVFTLDFSGIASFATVAENRAEPRDCTATSEHVLTCKDSLPFPTHLNLSTGIRPEILIAPTASAAQGNEGILRITVQADDFALSHDARVRVGAAANLAAPPRAEREAGVGESFTHAIQVANVGDTEVHGVALTFFNDHAFRAAQKFSNCTYEDDSPRTCQFDQTLSPGATYQVELPYVVGLDTFAPGGASAEFLWSTAAEFEDEMNRITRFGFDVGEPGTDGPLALTEVAAFGPTAIEADVEPANNWTSLTLRVTGSNGFDLAAVGDTLTGGVGDLVTAVVGIKNNGPATLDRSRIGSAAGSAYVTIPPGTTATEVPENCQPEAEQAGHWDHQNAGQPGRSKYRCFNDSMILLAGEAALFEITLRIDQVIRDAAGPVSILEPCQCDDTPVSMDLDHSNNLARILVNPTSTGGQRPPLADTGRPIGTIVALGGLLLLLGIAAVAVTVRRRRPVAR